MYNEYCNMIRCLADAANQEIAKGVFCPEVDGDGLGKVVDMIKDLESAKKDYFEAWYYYTVVKAMGEGHDQNVGGEDWEETMGFNPNRNSKGQYTTPSGRTRGFHPDYRVMEPRIYEDPQAARFIREMMMGYRDGIRGGNPGNTMSSDDDMMNSDHGRIYDAYWAAKRNYTQSRSSADKTMAEKRGKEYFVNGLRNMLEIYRDADPVMKKELKENFMGAVEEME